MVREAGLDVSVAIDAITSGGGGANAQLANLYPKRVMVGDFTAGFKLGYMVKDLGHVFDLAAELGVASPVGRAAGDRMSEGPRSVRWRGRLRLGVPPQRVVITPTTPRYFDVPTLRAVLRSKEPPCAQDRS
ncbi:NAD-binding protein [Streptomyces sp. L7]